MNENLKDKVVLLIGGSGSLGSFLAIEFAKKGACVIIGYNKSKANAEEAISLINSFEGKGTLVKVDVTKKESVNELVDTTVNMFEKLDILVNCAGISRNNLSWKTVTEDWLIIMETNLNGPFYCIQSVLPHMKKNNWGRIINISSIVGQIGIPGTSAYSASKAGLNGLTRTIATEVAKYGITINSLALGYFESGMISNVPSHLLNGIIDNIPMKRLGKLSELFHAINFLCANEAEYITGQTINLNGGLYFS